MRQLDSMFGNLNIYGDGRRSPYVSSVIEHDPHCDVHGSSRCSTPYRSSLYLHSRESTPSYYRDSVSPSNGLIIRSVPKYLISFVNLKYMFSLFCLLMNNVIKQTSRFSGHVRFTGARVRASFNIPEFAASRSAQPVCNSPAPRDAQSDPQTQ